MGSRPRAGGRYVVPVDVADGTSPTWNAVGRYTLTAGHTYVYILDGQSSPFQSVQITGYSSGLILTSATIQDTDHQVAEVSDVSTVSGEWITEDPSTGIVGADGAGWVATNSVLAVAGGAVGGALWHIAETGAARTRLIVVVGGTGGDVRVSAHGKD